MGDGGRRRATAGDGGRRRATAGTAIAFLVAPDGIEQVELTEPWEEAEQAGGTPCLVLARGAADRHVRVARPVACAP